ncbi:MAG: SpoIIE family protein phosphatase [Deltaproteobacteria bacterium]|nr:SpoIIE family protein phosphatase [Deltaproteobacteria bacterium]
MSTKIQTTGDPFCRGMEKNSINFSLRGKLFAMVVAAIALATIPIIMLASKRLADTGFKQGLMFMEDTTRIVEDNINAAYLASLKNRISDVLWYKKQLRESAALLRIAWNCSDADELHREMLLHQQSLSSQGQYMDVFTDGGRRSLLGMPQLTQLGLTYNQKDYKERPLFSLLKKDSLPPEGSFAVFRARTKENRGYDFHREVLVYFLPVPERDGVLSLAMEVDIATREKEARQEIIRKIQEKIDSLTLFENSSILLVDSLRQPLAHRGERLQLFLQRISPHAMQKYRSRAQAHLWHSRDVGLQDEILYRVVYFKSLDWYLFVTVPRNDIDNLSAELANDMVLLTLGALFICILLTLLVASRLFMPLQLLTCKVLVLAKTNFNTQNADVFAAGLPVNRGDEVGQLARAFAYMGRALEGNVRALLEMTVSKERMEAELNTAKEIQMGILPEISPEIPCEPAAFLVPAKEVGGDLYDCFLLDDRRLALVVGDVSDKGVPAALFMAMTLQLIRYALPEERDPGAVMTKVNNCLSASNHSCMFVTLFIGIFDPKSGMLEYANGGHCLPLVVASGGDDATVRKLEELSGPVVGALPDMVYVTHRAQLAEGDIC